MEDTSCYNTEHSQDGSIEDASCITAPSTTTGQGGQGGQHNQLGNVYLHGVPIVSLHIDGKERLCLAQISNTLLKSYSYNEIHNRRVALGITCVQCTPVQLELLRRAGAMPVSSRRCGMITRREAERLVKSFLDEISPPKLPENFAFELRHKCGWGCRGNFLPVRYNSSRAKCIRCFYCHTYFSPNKFIFHCHRPEETGQTDAEYRHPDAANFNAWRRHLHLWEAHPSEDLCYAWEDVKAMFNGGNRKRILSNTGRSSVSTGNSDDGCGGGGERSQLGSPEPKRAHRNPIPTPNRPGHIFSRESEAAEAGKQQLTAIPAHKFRQKTSTRDPIWMSNGSTSPDSILSKAAVSFDQSYSPVENWVPDLLGLKPAWQMFWSRHLSLLQQKGARTGGPSPLEGLPPGTTTQALSVGLFPPGLPPYPALQAGPLFSPMSPHGLPPHYFSGAPHHLAVSAGASPAFLAHLPHPCPSSSMAGVGVVDPSKIKYETKQVKYRDDLQPKLPEVIFPYTVPEGRKNYSIESLIREKTESI